MFAIYSLENECVNIEPRYKCSQCEYKAKRKTNLRTHVKRKHSIKKCDFCSYKTMLKLQLNAHIRVEHKPRYTCSQCGKKYVYLNSFNNHTKNLCRSGLHFECNHCSYSTIRKDNLKVHLNGQHSEIFLFGDSL